jgi:HK97 family phage major capsid protein
VVFLCLEYGEEGFMSTETNKALDQAELIVEIKSLEKNIVGKIDALEATGKQMQGEILTLGEAKAETVAKAEALSKQYDELYDRVQAVEQKSVAAVEQSGGFNLGAEFVKSEAAQAVFAGRQPSGRVEFKTAIINATGQNQPLVNSDRLSGIATTPNRMLTIRDVLPASTTTSNLVEFTRENAFTNNAGPTVSGSPQAFENVTKPESAITFTLVNVPVVTLAHWIPASRQVLDDSESLASHINGRLMYGLKLKEETQLLLGTGANGQLNGLYTQATAYTVASPTRTNEIDILRDAIKQAQVAEYMPNFVVLNPVDWFDIEIRKVGTSDARYVVGDPNNMRPQNLWGLPIVVTNSITAGTFLMGSSAAAEIKDRQQAAIEISRENDTNFVKNMVTVLAEERLALLVYRTEAFIKGSI